MRGMRTGGAAAIAVAVVLTGAAARNPQIGTQSGAIPTFVQQVSKVAPGAAKVAATLPGQVRQGQRLIVEVATWKGTGATTRSVTDSAHDLYTEVTHSTASDGTEMSVWTAPVTTTTTVTVTATPTATADIGILALDYTGLSTVDDATAVDQQAHATGTTGNAGAVTAGPIQPTTGTNELALGLYADSGFSTKLAGDPGWTTRANTSPNANIQLLGQDQPATAAGATPDPSTTTGAGTVWLAATLVLQSSAQVLPGAPTQVSASPGDAAATVTWAAPPSGGSTITSYTITPSAGATTLPTTTVTGSPAPTTATVGGLAGATTYTFTVTATNALGTGPASAASNPTTPSSEPLGQWSTVGTLPVVPVSAILAANGKLVFWDGWQQPQPSVLYDPGNPTATSTVDAPDSVFCDGGAELPDGRILVVGGYGGLTTGQIGIVDTNIFNPTTDTWTRVANMHDPRWYPTLTELANGMYVAVSGNSTDAYTWADTPEMYDPSTNTWTLLSKISTPQVHEDEYPFSYLAPNGDVFTIGPSEDNSFFLDPVKQTWTPVGGQSGIRNGSSIMYRPGQILYSGGAGSVDAGYAARATTAVLDLTAPAPQWQQIAPMRYSRIYHTLTMLANGTVLAVGGEDTSDQENVTTGVMPTEIWNPSTQTWTVAAPIAAARNYHSTAILLPSGQVFVGGGGHPTGLDDPGQYSDQIYSPSYLFAGARPTITAVPSSATYGSSIAVSTPDASSIGAVNLVSLGADTHQIDMDQHFVPLQFTAGLGQIQVNMPASGDLAPPGQYMLFVVGTNGVPSVASIVSVGARTAPSAPGAPTGVSAAAGDASAQVSWTAPAAGSSPTSGYTITPYVGGVAQSPTTVSGIPPATSATITGLANGTSYTFTVSATDAVGTGPASTPSNAVVPQATTQATFVQQVSKVAPGAAKVAATLPGQVRQGQRLIVEVATWKGTGATTRSVTDSAHDLYTEVTHSTASDGTEMSVWTAPVTTTTTVTVTATPTATADIGILALDYTGLSTVDDATAVDQQAHATGTTGNAGAVTAGPIQPTTGTNELALGLYADSGFSTKLAGDPGWTTRANTSPNANIQLLGQDQPATAAGATPDPSTTTGAGTVWLAATLVLQPATQGAARSSAGSHNGAGFVQSANARSTEGPAVAVSSPGAVASGDRLVVSVATGPGEGPPAVADAARDPFTEVGSTVAPDGTDLTVWSAPVGAAEARAAVRAAVRATASRATSIAVAVSDYRGLSAAPGHGALDVTAAASGTTAAASAVSSGSTAPTTRGPEVAIGVYADNGSGTNIDGGPGYDVRSDTSPSSGIELLTEDTVVGAKATPAASASTMPDVAWCMLTLVFRLG